MQINWIESPLMIIENSQIEHEFWMIKWSEINQNLFDWSKGLEIEYIPVTSLAILPITMPLKMWISKKKGHFSVHLS